MLRQGGQEVLERFRGYKKIVIDNVDDTDYRMGFKVTGKSMVTI